MEGWQTQDKMESVHLSAGLGHLWPGPRYVVEDGWIDGRMDGIDSISFTYLFKVIHSSKLLHQSCINTCRTNKQSLVLACYLNACEVASQTSLCTDLWKNTTSSRIQGGGRSGSAWSCWEWEKCLHWHLILSSRFAGLVLNLFYQTDNFWLWQDVHKTLKNIWWKCKDFQRL